MELNPFIWQLPTPFHLFDEEALIADAKLLSSGIKKHLPNAKLHYSIKTNSLLKTLSVLQNEGFNFEAITPGDLSALQISKINGEKIIFNGHARTKEDFHKAIYEQKAKYVFLDSLYQAELILELLTTHGAPTETKFGLRLNPGFGQFGFSQNGTDLIAVAKILTEKKLNLSALHIHQNLGGGEQKIEKIIDKFHGSLNTVIQQKKILEEKIPGLQITTFNLGGGFPSPHEFRIADKDLQAYWNEGKEPENASLPRPSIAEVAEGVAKTVSELLKKENLEKMEILFEPGRVVVARAMHTVLGIQNIKKDLFDPKAIWIVDGNTLMLTSTRMGVFKKSLLQNPKNKNLPTKTENIFIYGNLPYEADLLWANQTMPAAQHGDRLLIENTGAYFIPFEMNFGYPRPGIFNFNDGKIIRDRENIESIYSRE